MPPPAADPDPIADLRDRLRATQEAAARLAGGAETPRQGWAAPGAGGAGSGASDDAGLTEDLQQLVAVVASLRELVPPELQQQVTDLIRQVLILVRAILDRWIDRLEPGRGAEPDVEDIPIA
jgi:hypothetical protein